MIKIKPNLQNIRTNGGGHKEVGLCDLGIVMGLSFNKLNGPGGKRIGVIREINIGLNMGESHTNTCAEV